MTTIKALRELTPAGRMIRVALTRPEPDGTVGATVLESAAASHPSPRALAAASAHWLKNRRSQHIRNLRTSSSEKWYGKHVAGAHYP
jgi:hypothetical protein